MVTQVQKNVSSLRLQSFGMWCWAVWYITMNVLEGTFGLHLHGKKVSKAAILCTLLGNEDWDRVVYGPMGDSVPGKGSLFLPWRWRQQVVEKLVMRYQTVCHLIAEGHSPNIRFCENSKSYIVAWCPLLTEFERISSSCLYLRIKEFSEWTDMHILVAVIAHRFVWACNEFLLY
jgi:hypothetical protein